MDYDELERAFDNLEAEYKRLRGDHWNMCRWYDNLTKEHQVLGANYGELLTDNQKLSKKHDEALAMLKSLEWEGWAIGRCGVTLVDCCPKCHVEKGCNHALDCELDAMLREKEVV